MSGRSAPRGKELLDWVDRPESDTGVHWLDGADWRFMPYTGLADRVRGVAQQLAHAGVRHGDVIAVADSDSVSFLCSFFGALHAGATVSPLPAPEALGDKYSSQVSAICATASARWAIADSEAVTARLRAAAGRAGTALLPLDARQVGELVPRALADPAVLQFTSGTSGTPRGVRIGAGNLAANVAMVRDWLDVGPDDCGSSWLPFHHDMGLIGMLVAPTCWQATTWRMKPRDFLFEPLRWLESLGSGRATITAAPGFAYAYVARRVKPGQLRNLDFSGLRTAIVGAERLQASALAGFAELLAPRGFRSTVLRPAYGLAEATLAVTGSPLGSSPRAARVHRGSHCIGERVVVEGSGSLAELLREGPEDVLVGSGSPLPGTEVTIVGEDGLAAEDGVLGEIVVRGPAVASGYQCEHLPSATRFEGSRLFTGDAGFFLAGELYVLGRLFESLKVNGRTVFVEELEAALALPKLSSLGPSVIVATQEVNSVGIATVVEAPRGAWVEEVVSVLRPLVGPSVEIDVYAAKAGSIPRTTSGKPIRRQVWREIASGRLADKLAFSSTSAGPVGE